MQLSAHFSLAEFCRNSFDLALIPPGDHLASMRRVCHELLEPIREAYSCPVRVTSGYRTLALNDLLRAAGYPASTTSQHMVGEAADFTLIGKEGELYECFGWCQRKLVYGQCIYYYEPGQQRKEIIHIALGTKKENLIHHWGLYHVASTFKFPGGV
jgi:hypothetical protein